MKISLFLTLAMTMALSQGLGAKVQRHFNRSQLEALPKEITAALKSHRAGRIYYQKPLRPYPLLWEAVGRGMYERVSYTQLKSWIKRTDKEAMECFFQFVAASPDCLSPRMSILQETFGERDLLMEARQWTLDYGLVGARQLLTEALRPGGKESALESAMKLAVKNKDLIAPHSLMTLSVEERKTVQVFVVLGIDIAGDSPNRELIRHASRHLEKLGFDSQIVETSPFLGYAHNAKLIHAAVMKIPKDKKSLFFISASKGSADLLTMMLDEDFYLSAQLRQKVKGVVSLSGVLRSSNVARLISRAPEAFFDFARWVIWQKEKRLFYGIEDLGKSPFEGHNPSSLGRRFPNLKWISFSMLPDGQDAFVGSGSIGMEFQKKVTRYAEGYSPGDGLVETAATFLPPHTGVPEEVILGMGPHALAQGSFLDGTPIVPEDLKNDKGKALPAAGAFLVDVFLRSIHRSFLGHDF